MKRTDRKNGTSSKNGQWDTASQNIAEETKRETNSQAKAEPVNESAEAKPEKSKKPEKPKPKAKRKKGWFQKLIPWLGILIGLGVIGYYPASEAYDAWRRKQIIEQMEVQDAAVPEETKSELKEQAIAYNNRLAGLPTDIPSDEIWPYEKQLSAEEGDRAFGSILIPALSLRMPIYHSTEETVLMAGVGHLEATSLPIGGASTHTVLSAHTGMSNMRGFDEIDQLQIGDIFGIRTLNQTIAYEVIGSQVVLPYEMDALQIVDGDDLATLVTCTPYGVNTHRLLVHGRRTEVPDDYFDQKSEFPALIKSRRVWPFLLAIGLVLALIVLLALFKWRKKQKQKQAKQ